MTLSRTKRGVLGIVMLAALWASAGCTTAKEPNSVAVVRGEGEQVTIVIYLCTGEVPVTVSVYTSAGSQAWVAIAPGISSTDGERVLSFPLFRAPDNFDVRDNTLTIFGSDETLTIYVSTTQGAKSPVSFTRRTLSDAGERFIGSSGDGDEIFLTKSEFEKRAAQDCE